MVVLRWNAEVDVRAMPLLRWCANPFDSKGHEPEAQARAMIPKRPSLARRPGVACPCEQVTLGLYHVFTPLDTLALRQYSLRSKAK